MPNTVTYDDLSVTYDALTVTYDGEVTARSGAAEGSGRPRLLAPTTRASATAITLSARSGAAAPVVKNGQTAVTLRARGGAAAPVVKSGQTAITLSARARSGISVFAFVTSGTASIRAGGRAAVSAARATAGSAILRVASSSGILAVHAAAAPSALRGTGRASADGLRGGTAAGAGRTRGRLSGTGIRNGLAVALLRAFGTGRLAAEAVQFQTAVAVADLTDGTWTNELGSATALYASIDEASVSDADYIQSSLSPLVIDECRLILAGLENPGTSSNHTLRYRYQKSEPDGDRMDLTVRLYAADGLTVIAEQTHANIDTLTDAALVLSPGEAAAIPAADYAVGLVLGFRALKV